MTMVKPDHDLIVSLMSLFPEEMFLEIVGGRLESRYVNHTESQTNPEKRQAVEPRVYSELSKFWEPPADIAVANLEDGEARIFGDGVIPRKKRSLRHRSSCSRTVTTPWMRAIEKQRSITSVEPVLQNPNLDSESSPSSCVRGRSKEKRPIDVEERSPKKSKVVRCLEVEPIQTTPPDWLLNVMRREENGYNPKLISMKKLYETDLDKRQARLSVPFKQVKNPDFLTEEETRDIDEKALKLREDGVSVDLVDPEQNKHALDLRKRKMSGNWIYVLVKGWKDVVSANRFKVNDVFPLWSFRSGKGKLCFALVPSDATNSSHGGASTSGESGRGNSLSSGASTSGESGQVPLPVPPSPPARDSSHSGQGCSGESSSHSLPEVLARELPVSDEFEKERAPKKTEDHELEDLKKQLLALIAI